MPGIDQFLVFLLHSQLSLEPTVLFASEGESSLIMNDLSMQSNLSRSGARRRIGQR